MHILSYALAAALLAAPFSASALPTYADFTLDQDGGDGSVSAIAAAPGSDLSFELSGSDTGSGNLVVTTFTTTAAEAFSVSFDWAYESFDGDGPSYDPFGYVVDGVLTQVSDDAGLSTQSGNGTFNVFAGQTWGWYVGATDDDVGRATAAVHAAFGDVTNVPLPAAGLLLGAGLAGLGAAGARRTRGRSEA